jgi:hypothetical protein
MTNKIVGVFCFILAFACLVLAFVLPFVFTHYKGVAELPKDKALLLIQDKSSDSIIMTAYDKESDVILVSYNFSGAKSEAEYYGIPSSDKPDWGALYLLIGTFGFTILGINIYKNEPL